MGPPYIGPDSGFPNVLPGLVNPLMLEVVFAS